MSEQNGFVSNAICTNRRDVVVNVTITYLRALFLFQLSRISDPALLLRDYSFTYTHGHR